jgi:hypothetical protein
VLVAEGHCEIQVPKLRLPLWSAALMRRNFLFSRVNADGKQTGETNTEGETPMRFFFSPWEFRLPGRTICSSLCLENSVWQAEWSVRPGSAGPLKCGTVRLSGPVPPRQLKRGTVVGRTDKHTHCCNYIRYLKHSKFIIVNNIDYIWKKLWDLQRKMKNNLPLSSTTFINKFEGSCGTFGEGKE